VPPAEHVRYVEDQRAGRRPACGGADHPHRVGTRLGSRADLQLDVAVHCDPPPASWRRQVTETLKLAWAATEAMNAPVCALSCTPNSMPTSSGASSIDRNWAIRLRATGATAAVAT